MKRLVILAIASLSVSSGCTPTVQVATNEPIVLELNIRIEQDVRVRLDREIQELIGEERSAAIAPRGLESGAPQAVVDARAVGNAKREGHVGERPDGYLGVPTTEAREEARELVERVNERRRAEYARLAEQHEADRASVEALAGIQRTRGAQPGETILGPDGFWRPR